jgi:sugar lactone lactonase YvrE
MRHCLKIARNLFSSAVILTVLICVRSGGATNLVSTPPVVGSSLSVITSTMGSAAGVAVDPTGNVFAVDGANSALVEVVGGNGSQSTVLTGLTAASQVAMDASRNVYVADGTTNVVLKYAYSGGVLATTPTMIGTSLGTVTGVAVDLSGNVYIVDATNKQVVKVTSASVQTTLATAFTAPKQIAVDRLGNVYVADSGAGTVVMIPTGTTTSAAASTYSTIGSTLTLSAPQGVATDPFNNIYIADTGNNRIVQVPYNAGAPQTATPVVYVASVTTPVSLAIDTRSAMYIAAAQSSLYRYTTAGNYYGPAAATTGNYTVTGLYFGLLPVNTVSQTFPVTVTFNATVTPTAIKVVTTGLTGYDYNDAGGDTCAVGTTYSSGQSCIMNVTFTPLAPGPRPGAIVFYGALNSASTANVIAGTVYLGGGGLGAVINVDPGVVQTITLNAAVDSDVIRGVTQDAAGNIFTAGYSTSTVREYTQAQITAGANTGIVTAPQLTVTPAMGKAPNDVNIDGAGNMILTDGTTGVWIIPYQYVSGTNANIWFPTSIFHIATAITNARSAKVDLAGNVYSCNNSTGVLYELPAGITTATTTGNSLAALQGSNQAACTSIAVDQFGNLASTDAASTGSIYYYPATGAAATSYAAASSTGLWGVAFDATGSVWFSAYTSPHRVARLPLENGVLNATDILGLGSSNGAAYTYGIWVEPNGNLIQGLYESSQGASAFQVLNRQASALTAASTAVGSTSAAVAATLSNTGNLAPAAISTGAYYILYDVSDFVLDPTAEATPATYAACGSLTSTIQPGFACNLDFQFTPQSTSITLGSTAGTRNATYATSYTAFANPTITLTGVATGTASANTTVLTLAVSPTSPAVGGAITITASTTTASGVAAPTGSIQFYVDGVATQADALSAGVATYTIAAGLSIGSHTVTATYPGDSNYQAIVSTPASTTFTVLSLQTITFAPTITTYQASAGSFTLSATSSSGLTVSFASTTSSVCTVSGTTVTIVSGGSCSITATQAGNSTYAAATPVAVVFSIAGAAQTITYAPSVTSYLYSAGTIPLSATASSGLTVSFASTTTGVCTVTGTTATIVNGGICSIVASQAGSIAFSPATSVTVNYSITSAPQTITFAPSVTTYPYSLNGTFALSAISTNTTTAIAFASTTSSVCTVSGTTATIVNTGTCTIQATQTANTYFVAATPQSVSYTITVGSQTITFAPSVTSYPYVSGGTFPLIATSTSGLAVSFASTTPTICTVTGTNANMLTLGTCTIQATQGGNATFSAAVPVSFSYTISTGVQSITYTPTVTTYPYSLNGTFPLSATASSNLVVSFASTTPTICTVSGTTATIVSAGACTIQATQVGNSIFAPATPVSVSYTINPIAQTISYAPSVTSYPYAPSGSFALSATSTSGLVVSFASTTAGVCTVTGTTATTVAAGTCTIQATQAGNTDYLAASPVAVNYTINPAAQSITFAPSVTTYTYSVGGSFPLSATATSGLTVDFSSTTGSICSISGTTASILSAGTCTIQATQAGNANYSAATAVSVSFTIGKTAQSITYAPSVTSYPYSSAGTFSLSATATSGLAVGFASTTTGVCSVSGSTARILSGGTCTIQATQSGNTDYSAASAVSANYTITQATTAVAIVSSGLHITNGVALNTSLLGSPVTFTATLTSAVGIPTGTVNFVSGTTVLGSGTLSGGTATFTTSSLALGTVVIGANYLGDSNFEAITSAASGATLSQTVLTISIGTPSSGSSTTGSGSTQTVPPGGTASYVLPIYPSITTEPAYSFPSALTLTVTGLPTGAVATVLPAGGAWIPSTTLANTWTLSAYNVNMVEPPSNVPVPTQLIVNIPQTAAANKTGNGLGSKMAPLALALLLLPFAARMRRAGKRIGQILSVLLLLFTGMAVMAGVSGCMGNSGYFAQTPQSYAVTVTVSAGSLSQSTNLTLVVE